MIADSLLPDDIWAEAPDAPREAFLFLATAARQNLLQLLAGDVEGRGQHTAVAWRRQYVWELTSIANELGISGLPAPENAEQTDKTLSDFDAQLARVLTAIKAETRLGRRADSVMLSFQTKENLRQHLEELRAKIEASNLSADLKAALHKKVDAVESELDARRASMRPFWLLAGALSMAATTTSTLADAPAAIKTVETMVSLVHADRAAEIDHETRLSAPALTCEPIKQIEDHSSPTTT